MLKYLLILQICISMAFGISISGIVSDSTNGSPLIGANIMLKGNISWRSYRYKDGRYSIDKIPRENILYLLLTWDLNHLRKKSISKINNNLNIDILMIPEAIEMETYVVTASRRRERVEDAPAAISVISKAEIRRESNTNLGDYLKGTKGIDFTQSGIDSYNMTARGFNSSFSSRLLTLTDGRMANVPSLRLTAYNVIPVSFEDVEQIEVVLGPSSAFMDQMLIVVF